MMRLTCDQIIDRYRRGFRDFSNTECKSADFSGHKLKGIIFRGSDLEGSNFSGCNLDDADFSNCNLQWINFDHTSLRRTKFSKANLSWSKSTSPLFERTDFRNANLTEAYIFQADMGSADFTGAIKQGMVTKFSDINEMDLIDAESELRKRGMSIGIFMSISSGIEKMKRRWKRFLGIREEKNVFDENKKEKIYIHTEEKSDGYVKDTYMPRDTTYDRKKKYRAR